MVADSGDGKNSSPFEEDDSFNAVAADSVLPPKRRNGKPQSCEPCRKAKVSCDHTLPKCKRCVKKGIEAHCTYHPAPLTRSGSTPTWVTKTRSTPSRASDSNQAASNLLLMLSQQRTTDTPDQRQDNEPSEEEEFLGPTNYAAIFRETETQVGRDLWRSERAADVPTPRNPILYTADCTDSSIAIGVQILSTWPDQETCERLFKGEDDLEACTVWMSHKPSLEFALREIWSIWGAALKRGDYRSMATKLFETPPVSARSCRSSAEWVRSFTGANIRFEIIGVFLAMFSMSCMMLPVGHPLFNVEQNGKRPYAGRSGKRLYAERFGEAAEACYELCNEQINATEPLIWLLQYVQLAQSQYRGDDDAFLWYKAGNISSAITSFGLHRETLIDSSPFMVAQIRRRTFASAYIADKQLSTFTGRPPRLSKRFCSCKLPLDLSDEELMAEGEQLKLHMASLDENGWNKDEKLRPAGEMRIIMIASMIRDELLELCLGAESTDVTQARKREMRDRADALYHGVPKRFHLPTDPDEILTSEIRSLLIQLFFHIEHVFDQFLLERIPIKDSPMDNSDALIQSAMKVLECLEFIRKYSNKLGGLVFGESWHLVYNFLPAASLLCIELLKQHQYPRRYKSHLPRAEAIRLLHLYQLGMELVGPDEGNYRILQRMHKVVTRVLKEILEPVPAMTWDETPATQTTPGGSYQVLPDIDLTAVMGPNDDPEFLDWFQSVDWAKAPWMDPIAGI